MENKEILNLDPTSYDFDLFSMDIYRDRRRFLNNEVNTRQLFMVATAGMNFDVRKINWEKNHLYLRNLANSDITFETDVIISKKSILKRYNTEIDTFNFEESYLKSFRYFASKGFYAYDKKYEANSFELIVKPIYDIVNYEKLLRLIVETYGEDRLENFNRRFENLKISEGTNIKIESTSWYRSRVNK